MAETYKFEGEEILSISGLEHNSDEIRIETDKSSIIMNHYQDCCEYVRVEEVVGITDLVGAKLFVIDEKSNEAEDVGESGTYTFYTIQTSKGYLDIRWLGESNGYYSESVNISINKKK